jgi:hypothetical protein
MLRHWHILYSIKIPYAQDHNVISNNIAAYDLITQSQWPHGFRRGSAAAGLLGLWVRIPPGPLVPASCECWVPSGRGLRDGQSLVQRSPADCCISECGLEASAIKEALAHQGL